jgi:hypothetical protein
VTFDQNTELHVIDINQFPTGTAVLNIDARYDFDTADTDKQVNIKLTHPGNNNLKRLRITDAQIELDEFPAREFNLAFLGLKNFTFNHVTSTSAFNIHRLEVPMEEIHKLDIFGGLKVGDLTVDIHKVSDIKFSADEWEVIGENAKGILITAKFKKPERRFEIRMAANNDITLHVEDGVEDIAGLNLVYPPNTVSSNLIFDGGWTCETINSLNRFKIITEEGTKIESVSAEGDIDELDECDWFEVIGDGSDPNTAIGGGFFDSAGGPFLIFLLVILIAGAITFFYYSY